MCGIFGFVDRAGVFDQGALEKMSQLLLHRGPDDFGFFVDQKNGIYFGHRRLSIVDLSSAGHQPMANEDGTIQIIFNGEIFNFKEIREELIARGHAFSSRTDTEVIIHAYEEYGMGCLQKFNGMFAFAIYDKRKQEIVLVRDRIGIKPLYYQQRDNIFSWASEVTAFRALGKLQINPTAISELLGFQYLPSNERTTIKDVFKLPPGHFLIYNMESKTISIAQYWKLKLDNNISGLAFSSAKEGLEKLLIDSIKLRLEADVDVGVMLSGGLDSSVIAAIAQKNSSKRVRTYTAGFDEKKDERPFAKIVANYIGAQYEEVMIVPGQIVTDIEKLITHFDDLNTFDGGLLVNYLIADKMHERGIKVILLGEGADEIFGGYSWFGLSKLPFNALPTYLKKYLYYYSTSRNLSFAAFRHFQEINKMFSGLDKKNIRNTFDLISNYEITCQLPNNYLMKVDKGTMAQSVEARVPYLDYRVVEFAYSLKTDYKLKGLCQNFKKTNEKYILREIARNYLPDEIVTRKKRGGMISIAAEMKSNISKVKYYLLDKKSLGVEFFGKKKMEKLFANDGKDLGGSNWNFVEVEKEMFLWKLFILEVWRQNYFKL